MVASVWDGSHVRRENKERLKRLLAMSISEKESEAGPGREWRALLMIQSHFTNKNYPRIATDQCMG